jgi:hypothetical protein
MTMILKIIGQWDGKYLMMLQIKIITAVLNVSTYIITSDAACPIILPVYENLVLHINIRFVHGESLKFKQTGQVTL